MRHAQLCALLVNLWSKDKVKVKDFVPDWWEEHNTSRLTDWQAMRSHCLAYTLAVGGQVIN